MHHEKGSAPVVNHQHQPQIDLLLHFCSLVSGDVLSNLIDLIIREPPDDVDPTNRFKCAHVAAELLSCEVPQVTLKDTFPTTLVEIKLCVSCQWNPIEDGL